VSFVGFVPAQKPVFAIVVVVDSPHRVSPYGGVVAAPIFQKIAQTALRHYGVPQSIDAPNPVFAGPIDGGSMEQPASGPVAKPRIVAVGGTGTITVFPDLTGMSARDALRVLAQLGMTARLQGTGVVTQQYPPPGEPIESASTVVLKLGRQDPDQIASAARP
jgi:cell division protein FtsI (penicillin-binding protein 3)